MESPEFTPADCPPQIRPKEIIGILDGPILALNKTTREAVRVVRTRIQINRFLISDTWLELSALQLL